MGSASSVAVGAEPYARDVDARPNDSPGDASEPGGSEWEARATTFARPARQRAEDRELDTTGIGWNDKRRDCAALLFARDPLMAQYYASSVYYLHTPSAPARLSHLAHAVRELANHMPSVMGIDRRTRRDLDDAVKVFTKRWVAAGLPRNNGEWKPNSAATDSLREDAPPHADVANYVIPEVVAAAAVELVGEQQAATSNAYARAALMITGIDDSAAHARGQGHPRVRQWRALVDKFFPYVHAADNRRPDPAEESLHEWFAEWEDVLLSIVRPALDHVADLDHLLQRANTRPDDANIKREAVSDATT
jgi:hypothetical protein